MVVPLRRRATQPSAQRPSQRREAKRCERQSPSGAELMKSSNRGRIGASFRADVKNAGYCRFAGIEDLITMKTEAGRPQGLRDIEELRRLQQLAFEGGAPSPPLSSGGEQ